MSGGRDPDIGRKMAERAAQVRQRVTLSGVIGRDVKLRKAGRGELTGLCPFHAQKNDGSFMVNDAKALFHCFSCGANGDVLDYVMRRKGMTFVEALRELASGAGIDFRDARQKAEFDRAAAKRERAQLDDDRRRRANAHSFWLNGAPGKDTPAHWYLRERVPGLDGLGHFPGSVRFVHDAYNSELKRKMPAMATAIFDPNGTFLATHRTFLERLSHGRWVKAAVEKPKMVLGSYFGGSMTLWKGRRRGSLAEMPAGAPIALSEGIEDGLSVAVSAPELRVHAAISLDNIGNVILPAQVGDLTILCQRDGDQRMALAATAWAEGREDEARHHERCALDIEAAAQRAIAKQQAQAREHGANRSVLLAWPQPGFKDFNDQLVGKRMVGL